MHCFYQILLTWWKLTYLTSTFISDVLRNEKFKFWRNIGGWYARNLSRFIDCFTFSSSTATRYKQWVEILSEDSSDRLIFLVVVKTGASLHAYLNEGRCLRCFSSHPGVWCPRDFQNIQIERDLSGQIMKQKRWVRSRSRILGSSINTLLPEIIFTHFAMGYSAFPLSWPGVSWEPLSLTLITNEPAIAFTIDDIHL